MFTVVLPAIGLPKALVLVPRSSNISISHFPLFCPEVVGSLWLYKENDKLRD
jgi:hypothetical protein